MLKREGEDEKEGKKGRQHRPWNTLVDQNSIKGLTGSAIAPPHNWIECCATSSSQAVLCFLLWKVFANGCANGTQAVPLVRAACRHICPCTGSPYCVLSAHLPLRTQYAISPSSSSSALHQHQALQPRANCSACTCTRLEDEFYSVRSFYFALVRKVKETTGCKAFFVMGLGFAVTAAAPGPSSLYAGTFCMWGPLH
eukprot:scaffold285967_cov15-Tisochrysis_lutea.AAC.1